MDKSISEFKSLSDCLQNYYSQIEKADRAWEKAQDKARCYSCEHFTDGVVDFFAERHKNCAGCPKQKKVSKLAENVDCINSETEEFILNTYAKAVFDYYSLTKPLLVRGTTGETIAWEEAFGTQFDEVPKTLRYSLVGLAEGFGRYKIKTDKD